MKALRFDGRPAVVEIDAPAPRPGEARVRVRLAGICSTDLHITRGYMSFTGTLGHELVGEVVTHPDPSWIGRRVTAEINLACRICARCRRGLGRHCGARTVLGILGKDGCFAEEVTLPIENLHAVPDGVSDELAVFTEPLAAAFEILEQVHVPPASRVAVLGDGKLGILCALVLAGTGADVILIGRHDEKLAHAAAHVRTATSDARIDGAFDLVVEATGTAEGFARARELTAPRGTLVLKSTFHGATKLSTAPLVIDEITLVGSRCGPFPPALRALAARRIDPSPLIEATFPLTEGVRALEAASRRGARKVLLRP